MPEKLSHTSERLVPNKSPPPKKDHRLYPFQEDAVRLHRQRHYYFKWHFNSNDSCKASRTVKQELKQNKKYLKGLIQYHKTSSRKRAVFPSSLVLLFLRHQSIRFCRHFTAWVLCTFHYYSWGLIPTRQLQL